MNDKRQWCVLIVTTAGDWRPGAVDSLPREIAGARIHVRKLGRDQSTNAARAFNLGQLQQKEFNGEWALVAFAPTKGG